MQKILLTVLFILIATPVIASADNRGIALRPVAQILVECGTENPRALMGRLGTGAARADERMDSIIALAEQKEAQGNRLEDLRRQSEIERLKKEDAAKRVSQIKAELAKERDLAGEFVNVPGGCFIANSEETCVDSFRIGKYEVTQGQYKRIMGNNPSFFRSCGDDCPVEIVSWSDAQSFINRLNNQSGGRYRLPTEAEWEYACTSGGKQEEYCGGDDNIDAVAWFSGNSGGKTHPVGQKQANGLGIYDMSGNVWEFVQDWYDDSYPSSQRNPTGASSGFSRVIRGGSWVNEPSSERASYRDEYPPDLLNHSLGFRLVSPTGR